MAPEDSRWQDLTNMQNSANSATSPNDGQPSGQFSGDDIEFESFMFDPGTGPLTPQSLHVDPAGNRPQPQAAAPVEISGQDVPVPSYLRGPETPPQSQHPSQPLRPLSGSLTQQRTSTGPLGTRGTGPLSSANNTSTNLGARLSQGGEGNHPSGSLSSNLESLRRRGTGPLSTGSLSGAKLSEFGGVDPEGVAAASQGPINPAYFKAPTGPLGTRQGTGPLGQRSSVDASSMPSIEPLRRGTGPLNTSHLRSLNEPSMAQTSAWSDNELASVEDFSQVLLAMLNAPMPTAGYSTAGTITPLREMAPQVQAPQVYDYGYGASVTPPLEQVPTPNDQMSSVEEALGWGTMTGAPTASDYEAAVRISSPLYSGPEMDRVVPLDEAQAQQHAQFTEEEPAVHTPVISEASMAGAGLQQATQTATEDNQTEEAGKFNPDELEFESFMFNPGLGGTQVAETAGPPLPDMESFMPAVTAMESAFEAPAPAATQAVEQPVAEATPAQESWTGVEPAQAAAETAQQSQAEQAPPQMEYAQPEQAMETQQPVHIAQPQVEAPAEQSNTEQQYAAQDYAPTEEAGTEQALQSGPLPFWLQDTSDLEAIARQGHINVPGIGDTPEEPATEAHAAVEAEAPAPAAMQAAPLEAPAQPATNMAVEMPTEAPTAMQPEQPVEAPAEQALESMMPTMEPQAEMQAQVEQEPDQAEEPQSEPMLAYGGVSSESEVDVDAYDIDLAMPDMTFPDMVAPHSADAAQGGQELDQFAAYEDLPPIEPFDFGALNLHEEEESLGFNTEELSGMMPSRHDPMRATADLDVLSDIFDGEDINALDTPGFMAASPVTDMGFMDYIQDAMSDEQEPVQFEQSAQPAQQEAAPAPIDLGSPQTNWTSIVTSHLNPDALGDIDSMDTGRLVMPPAASIAPATPPVQSKPAQPSAPSAPEEELGADIQPFDFTQLNLENNDEMPTEALGSGRTNPANNTASLGVNELNTGIAWSDEDAEDDDDDMTGGEHDTSLFMLTQPRLIDKSPRSTRWLTEDVLQNTISQQEPVDSVLSSAASVEPAATTQEDYSAHAEEEAPSDDNTIKARVAWADSTGPLSSRYSGDQDAGSYPTEEQFNTWQGAPANAEPDLGIVYQEEPQPEAAQQWQQAEEVQEAQVAQEAEEAPVFEPVMDMPEQPLVTPLAVEPLQPVAAPAPRVETPSVPAYQYQPMQSVAPEAAPAPQPAQFEMPKVGAVRDIFTSGPLPELEGFDQLRQMVDNNPDDIGAHMALASAYSQLGDNDTAVRVYRRILRKRNVSPTFLRLITEELNDFESEMQGNAHYHQVRGDLYTRTGRNYEAIQEYNKIV